MYALVDQTTEFCCHAGRLPALNETTVISHLAFAASNKQHIYRCSEGYGTGGGGRCATHLQLVI